MKILLFLLFGIGFAPAAFSQEPVYPVPEGNPNQLFYLQRTPNANTVVYELNMKDGVLDVKEPVHVFWIRYGEQGQRAELSGIQRKFAYGIKTKMLGTDAYEIRFLAYEKAVYSLRKDNAGEFHVYTNIGSRPAILSSIYLKINGGTLWSPNIEYAELKGKDAESGVALMERVPIKK